MLPNWNQLLTKVLTELKQQQQLTELEEQLKTDPQIVREIQRPRLVHGHRSKGSVVEPVRFLMSADSHTLMLVRFNTAQVGLKQL